MGFIGKIFGAIVGFIVSVLTFPLKLFGFGKKSEYFLEDDSLKATSSTPSTISATPEQKPSSVASAEPKAQSTPEPVAAQSSASEPVPQADSKPASAPEPAMASVSEAAKQGAQQNGQVFSKPVENVTFAPEKLLTLKTTGGRRRPGPSMSPFKDMAKQVSVR